MKMKDEGGEVTISHTDGGDEDHHPPSTDTSPASDGGRESTVRPPPRIDLNGLGVEGGNAYDALGGELALSPTTQHIHTILMIAKAGDGVGRLEAMGAEG